MRVCIAIGACVVRTSGAVTGGAWDGVAWLGIDEGYYRYFPYYAYDYYPYDYYPGYYADLEPYYNNERNAIRRHYCNAAATVPLVFPQMRRVYRHKQARRIVLRQRQSLAPLKISMQALERRVAEAIADRLARVHARTQMNQLTAAPLRDDTLQSIGRS
jgi:hypothetical protein